MVGIAGMTMVMSREESSVERHRGSMMRAVLAAEVPPPPGDSSPSPPVSSLLPRFVDDSGGNVSTGPSLESGPDRGGWPEVITVLRSPVIVSVPVAVVMIDGSTRCDDYDVGLRLEGELSNHPGLPPVSQREVRQSVRNERAGPCLGRRV